ncbi:MAG TPA: outer membrane protein assembly factor BamA [bacterium]|nr:outer membrane protein assembly factor BamA [bacterium]
MKKLVFVMVMLASVLSAQAAVVDASDYEYIIIEDIRLNGLETVTEKEVLDTIVYGVGMVYSRYKTRGDIKKLYNTGKFEDIKVSLKNEGGRTVIVYEFVERPIISRILIKGNKQVGDGDIKSKLDIEDQSIKIKEGEYYNELMAARAVAEITKMYRDKNFYYAKVSHSLAEHTETGRELPGKRVRFEIEVEEGEKVKVKSIKAVGNRVFGVDKIKGLMDTKEDGWFVSGVFDEDKFIEDLKKILAAYHREGYVKARIGPYTIGEIDINRGKIIDGYVNIDGENNAIHIEIPVEEGIKYTVKSINASGSSLFEEEYVLDRIETRKGRVFDRAAYENDLNIIRNLFSGKGHIFAQVKENVVYDDDVGAVAIQLEMADGPVAYINQVKVRGNYVTKDKVIIRELNLEEGQPFDSNRIRRAQENIYNLGFFDNIVIDTEQVDIDRLNLVFEVTERKTGNIGLGAGYSTVEGIVGYVQLSQSNLFGEGKGFSADVQFGNQKKSWQLSYKDPWLFDTPTSFGIDVWNIFKNTAYNNQGYDLDTYGFNLSFGRRIGLEHKTFITYRYQQDKFSNISSQLQGIVHEEETQISSITPMYVYDTRDDIFDANRGAYGSLSVQLGGGLLGGDFNYIKTVGDIRYFVPSFWKFVLGMRARVGHAAGYDYSYGSAIVPVVERFYAGGTDTVRGYGERSLGPIAGGNFLVVTNIEYKLKLVERVLTLAAFYDSGNCWMNFDEVDWTNPFLYSSVGFGIRLTIPGTVMLLRLDWGYGLVPEAAPPGGQIHFNIGNIF